MVEQSRWKSELEEYWCNSQTGKVKWKIQGGTVTWNSNSRTVKVKQ